MKDYRHRSWTSTAFKLPGCAAVSTYVAVLQVNMSVGLLSVLRVLLYGLWRAMSAFA